MAMHNKGLSKLMEECGELICEAGKAAAYLDNLDQHPDGKGDLKERLADEIGDVMAALIFVICKLDLDEDRIGARTDRKYGLFVTWDKEPEMPTPMT